MPLPEQPGEPRVSVHWLFLPLAVFYIAAALICSCHHQVFWGWFCFFLGLFPLLMFLLYVVDQIRTKRPPDDLFTIRARVLILGAIMAVYMFLYIVVLQRVTSKWAWMLPFFFLFWPISGGLIWNGIVHYFINHPPKFRLPKL